MDPSFEKNQKCFWATIWSHPRDTIAKVVAENPDRSIWILSAIYGFSALLNMSQSASLGLTFNLFTLLMICIILSPLWGYIIFSLWSLIVLFTGKLFKGEGTFKTIRAAYAWSAVPLIINIPLWILMTLIFGAKVFINFPEGYQLTDSQITILFFILIAKVILSVWSLVIFLNALSEVQNYSILRAIFNVIVAGIVVFVAFMAMWWVFMNFTQISSGQHKIGLLFMQRCLEVLRRNL